MEKTFEELALDESFRMNFGNEEVPMVKVYDVVKLLQQVREATIAECEQYIEDNPEIALDFTRGREIKINLPTDRIKIEPLQKWEN